MATVIAIVLALLGAGLHVYIWMLEALWWTGRARAVFGTTAEQAEATRDLALNQGFYNLFLAIVTVIGTGFAAAGALGVGGALILAGTGSMLAAAIVLMISDPTKRRAALTQGALPLLAVVATVIALVVR